MSFVTFAERAVAPPIKKVLAYKAPNGVMSESHLETVLHMSLLILTMLEHYRMTIEWSTEHDTYSKFLHNLDIHNDFIVQRVAVQFPDLVSVTNVDGMTDDDIEKTKAHHIWEKVQYRASMHFHVDTRKSSSVSPCHRAKY